MCAWSVKKWFVDLACLPGKSLAFWLFMWTINEGAKKWQVGGDGFLGNNKISSERNVCCKVNIGPLFLYLFLKLKVLPFLSTTFAQIKTAWKYLISKIIPTYFVRKGTGQIPFFGSFPFAFVLQLLMEKIVSFVHDFYVLSFLCDSSFLSIFFSLSWFRIYFLTGKFYLLPKNFSKSKSILDIEFLGGPIYNL